MRDARGRLLDRDGIVLDDAICEECRGPESSAYLKLFQAKWRCMECMHFWEAALKPKPSLHSALLRARRAKLPATLTEEEWQQALEHFKQLCAYCGKNPWSCVEHATPLPPGGTTADNCVPSCGICNALKRGRTLEEMVHERSAYSRKAEAWLPALIWLRSRGRPVITAEQARQELASATEKARRKILVSG